MDRRIEERVDVCREGREEGGEEGGVKLGERRKGGGEREVRLAKTAEKRYEAGR